MNKINIDIVSDLHIDQWDNSLENISRGRPEDFNREKYELKTITI